MSERQFRKKVLEVLKPIGAFPVENSVHDGVPDVCCVAGWIELKVAVRPHRADTRVDIELRPAQRIWLRKWRQHGGRAWTYTRLEDHTFLHDGLWASDHLGLVSEAELRTHAIAVWAGVPSFDEFARALMSMQMVN